MAGARPSAARARAPVVPGLEIESLIGQGAFSQVYRTHKGDRTYVLKLISAELAAQLPSCIDSARRRMALAARLDHPGLPRVVSLGDADGAPYVITELVNGETLAAKLRNGPLVEPEAVEIARCLADALVELHGNGLTHRDIKPENIVLHDGRATLVDLDLLEIEGAIPDATAIGTLLYAAPELSGTLQHPVDPRSDLYSLGAVLYDSVTGQPPFLAQTASELVREHTFSAPAPVDSMNPNVTPGLTAIISKLLAKEPEERYQSADGLLFDLGLLPTYNILLAEGRQVSLGSGDQAPPVRADHRSTARAEELEHLRQLWQTALDEEGGAAIVAGPPGSGKSVLTGKLAAELRAQDRLVLIGASAADETPFGVVRSAIEHWLAGLRSQPVSSRERAEQRIRIAAGEYGGILGVLVPQLASICRAAPSRIDSFASERFVDIVTEFLIRLGGCFGGMLLVLDDVASADPSTQAVVKRLSRQLAQAPIFVVATVRATRADVFRDIEQLLDSANPRVLWLKPLTGPALEQVIAHELGGQAISEDVREHVAGWTDGNPLAVSEYTQMLLEAGALQLQWGTWTLQPERLQEVALPADVSQLLSQRIVQLDAATRETLQLAALMGMDVDPSWMRAVSPELSPIDTALAAAARLGLIRAQGAGYVFSNEDVRAKLLEHLSESEQATGHLLIAHGVERLARNDEHTIYLLARHYALAGSLADQRRVYETSRAAGEVALARYANAEAYEFLTRALDAAAQAGITPNIDLEADLGAVCARSRRWAEAVRHLTAAIEQTSDTMSRAGLRAELARVFLANRDASAAWLELERAFHDAGTPVGRGPFARTLYHLWCWLVGAFSLVTHLGYGSAPRRSTPRLTLLGDLYVVGAYVSYFQNRRLRILDMTVRLLYAGHMLGDSVAAAGAYTAFGNILAMLRLRRLARKFGERAITLARKLDSRFLLARIRMFQAFQAHLAGDPRTSAQLMRECLRVDGTWLDAVGFTFAHDDLAWNLLMRGYCREALELIERALTHATPDSGERFNLVAKAAALLAVLGRDEESAARTSELASASQMNDAPWPRADYADYLLLVHVERGDMLQAEALLNQRSKLPGPRRAAFHSKQFYVIQAYAHLRQAEAQLDAPACLARFRSSLAQLRRAGHHPTLRCHRLSLQGALYRLEGRMRQAASTLQQAQVLATEFDNPWALFEAQRQLAHCFTAFDNQQAAMRQARQAHRLAVEFNWVNRARRLRDDFHSLRAPAESRQLTIDGEPMTFAPEVEPYLDRLLRVSAAATGSLDPREQARLVLDEILRLLDAERGFLFLCLPDGELSFTAARNDNGQDLHSLSGYSRGVVEAVRASREPVLVNTADAEATAPDRNPAEGARTIVAAPLLLRDRLLGVIYVDSRSSHRLPGSAELKMLTAVAGPIAVAFDATAVIAEQRTLARANADLMDALRLRIADLQTSSERIVAAEERLRRDIAELLHSRVQSQLLVAVERLRRARLLVAEDPDQACAAIDQVQTQLDEIREHEVREASHLLHPSFIRRGLVLALESLVSRFEELFRIEVEVDPRVAELDSVVENRLPETVRLAAYRGVEEALGNVQRHAKASWVQIKLSIEEPAQLRVEIVDNGQGFDASQVEMGLGLGSISGRIAQLAGHWQIVSQPGQGTRVILSLPLSDQPASSPADT